ncbi:hypothetical protein MIR68_008255 [Amoeboaphelidium protococcarum]|nr:hypothetical protein MIR68_008255 [Amoeboaphelidium protococcarum]
MTVGNKKFSLVVAASTNNAIGRKGQLPWHLPGDLKFFEQLTSDTADPSSNKNSQKQNAVIMGRRTWESIPVKYRPLRNRLNIVLTSQPEYKSDGLGAQTMVCRSLQDAVNQLQQRQDIDKIFICGGGNVYAEAMEHPDCDKVYLTRVGTAVDDCDAFFEMHPEFTMLAESEMDAILKQFLPRKRVENGIEYEFQIYQKSN